VRALISFFLTIGGVVSSFLAIAFWIRARPQSSHARRVLLTVALVYTLLAVYGLTSAAGRLLFLGYEPLVAADLRAAPTAIVLLGSGSFTTRDWNGMEYSIVDHVAASRLMEAARVFRMLSDAWIISSGGKVRPDTPHAATAITMRQGLLEVGIPTSRILVEAKSRNTHEEAVIVAQMLRDLKVDQVVLVTSDVHMRRSIGTFRAEGVLAIPAIARDPYQPRSWDEWIVPGDAGLWKGGLVVHELIGIAYYTVRGWYSL
jgi:uncharacterized SAM-binding protein YcdF (DUF218 family)